MNRSITLARSQIAAITYDKNVKQAREWIEGVLGEKLPSDDLADVLKDGVYLCRLIHALAPHLDMKVITSTPHKMRVVENINGFLAACAELGLNEKDMFSPGELYENKNFTKVLKALKKLSDHFATKGFAPWETVAARKDEEGYSQTQKVNASRIKANGERVPIRQVAPEVTLPRPNISAGSPQLSPLAHPPAPTATAASTTPSARYEAPAAAVSVTSPTARPSTSSTSAARPSAASAPYSADSATIATTINVQAGSANSRAPGSPASFSARVSHAVTAPPNPTSYTINVPSATRNNYADDDEQQAISITVAGNAQGRGGSSARGPGDSDAQGRGGSSARSLGDSDAQSQGGSSARAQGDSDAQGRGGSSARSLGDSSAQGQGGSSARGQGDSNAQGQGVSTANGNSPTPRVAGLSSTSAPTVSPRPAGSGGPSPRAAGSPSPRSNAGNDVVASTGPSAKGNLLAPSTAAGTTVSPRGVSSLSSTSATASSTPSRFRAANQDATEEAADSTTATPAKGNLLAPLPTAGASPSPRSGNITSSAPSARANNRNAQENEEGDNISSSSSSSSSSLPTKGNLLAPLPPSSGASPSPRSGNITSSTPSSAASRTNNRNVQENEDSNDTSSASLPIKGNVSGSSSPTPRSRHHKHAQDNNNDEATESASGKGNFLAPAPSGANPSPRSPHSAPTSSRLRRSQEDIGNYDESGDHGSLRDSVRRRHHRKRSSRDVSDLAREENNYSADSEGLASGDGESTSTDSDLTSEDSRHDKHDSLSRRRFRSASNPERPNKDKDVRIAPRNDESSLGRLSKTSSSKHKSSAHSRRASELPFEGQNPGQSQSGQSQNKGQQRSSSNEELHGERELATTSSEYNLLMKSLNSYEGAESARSPSSRRAAAESSAARSSSLLAPASNYKGPSPRSSSPTPADSGNRYQGRRGSRGEENSSADAEEDDTSPSADAGYQSNKYVAPPRKAVSQQEEEDEAQSAADAQWQTTKYVAPPRKSLLLESVSPNPTPRPKKEINPGSEESVQSLIVKLDEMLKARDKDDGKTILHLAVQENEPTVVQYLLGRGENPNIADSEGTTPMHIAAAEGNIDMVQALIAAGGDINTATLNDVTPLQSAVEQNRPKMIKAMTEKFHAQVNTMRRNDGWTPLYTAAYKGTQEIVNTLLSSAANPNVRNKEGWTALHAAAHQGHFNIVKDLLNAKAYLNTQSNQGTTPLFHAVEGGWMRIIKFIVERGADVNRCNEGGWAPLHMAVYKGYNDVTEYLISHNVSLNDKVYDEGLKGYTPLHIIVSIDKLSDDSKKNLHILLSHGADPYATDDTGATALHLACYWNNVDAVEIFSSHFPEGDVIYELEDINGRSPAEVAVYYGNQKVAGMLAAQQPMQNNERITSIMVGPAAPPSPSMLKQKELALATLEQQKQRKQQIQQQQQQQKQQKQ